MGIIDAAFDSFSGTLADQWKDIITPITFDERTAVVPGIRKNNQNGYGNNHGLDNVLSSGSIIYIPENTAAFIFSQSGIEDIIMTPGGYEYRNGQLSVFDDQSREEAGILKSVFSQTAQRIGFSGITPDEKRVSYINLRELRGIKFGTHGPLTYNDRFYGTDLEIHSYGLFNIKITDPVKFIRNFVPANVQSYTFDELEARKQLVAEFLHSFIIAVNSLSSEYRISQLPSQANVIAEHIKFENANVGTWTERFGITLTSLAIENIEFSTESRELVRRYSEKKMDVAAYEGISTQAGNMAAQQMIAEGVRDRGLGEGGSMLFGLGFAGGLNPQNASVKQAPQANSTSDTTSEIPANMLTTETSSLNEQVETLKKLKELVDMEILSQEEFDMKKKQVLGL